MLRNREKKEYCVVCENYFQREQDLEHGKYTVVAPEPVSAALPPLPPAPTTLPPPPQTPSPALPPQHQAVTSVTSPSIRASSPLASPSFGRNRRDSAGRVSGSIILPPAAPMPSSLASASQQILGKHLSEDLDVSLSVLFCFVLFVVIVCYVLCDMDADGRIYFVVDLFRSWHQRMKRRANIFRSSAREASTQADRSHQSLQDQPHQLDRAPHQPTRILQNTILPRVNVQS